MVQVGETVYAVGNPRGLEGTFSDGIISSIRPVGSDKLIQITAPLSPGSSGGPVLNRRGEVIGVSVLTIRDGQNLNFAIPSNYLRTLHTKIEYVKSLSQAKAVKGHQSILSDFGGRGAVGVTGGKFQWSITSPENAFLFSNLDYTFSLRNSLRESVKNVHYLVIFYDELGDPIDANFEQFSGVIPAGLAKRIKGIASDSSVKELSTRYEHLDWQGLRITPNWSSIFEETYLKETYVKFRILDFEIVR